MSEPNREGKEVKHGGSSRDGRTFSEAGKSKAVMTHEQEVVMA